MENIPKKIITEFAIDQARITPIAVGLVHQTYKAETDAGVFVLQKQHRVFGPYVIENLDIISRYLAKKGIQVQRVVKTTKGKLYAKDGTDIWRLLTFIPGRVVEIVKNDTIAYEAGRILGVFHRAMEDFRETLDNKRFIHDSPVEYRRFFNAMKYAGDKRIENLCNTISENFPKLFLPNNLRAAIIHGDPKISNIVFDEELRHARAMIDLDGCQPHTPLVDLGDAFRSWCGGEEDNPQNAFNTKIFTATLAGYKKGSAGFLNKSEVGFLVQAIQLITIELASRFLRDYEEDKYFGWDREKYASRKEHNLARAKGQLSLFQSIVAQKNALQQIARETLL